MNIYLSLYEVEDEECYGCHRLSFGNVTRSERWRAIPGYSTTTVGIDGCN